MAQTVISPVGSIGGGEINLVKLSESTNISVLKYGNIVEFYGMVDVNFGSTLHASEVLEIDESLLPEDWNNYQSVGCLNPFPYDDLDSLILGSIGLKQDPKGILVEGQVIRGFHYPSPFTLGPLMLRWQVKSA